MKAICQFPGSSTRYRNVSGLLSFSFLQDSWSFRSSAAFSLLRNCRLAFLQADRVRQLISSSFKEKCALPHLAEMHECLLWWVIPLFEQGFQCFMEVIRESFSKTENSGIMICVATWFCSIAAPRITLVIRNTDFEAAIDFFWHPLCGQDPALLSPMAFQIQNNARFLQRLIVQPFLWQFCLILVQWSSSSACYNVFVLLAESFAKADTYLIRPLQILSAVVEGAAFCNLK